jgi:hypothetical protein
MMRMKIIETRRGIMEPVRTENDDEAEALALMPAAQDDWRDAFERDFGTMDSSASLDQFARQINHASRI